MARASSRLAGLPRMIGPCSSCSTTMVSEPRITASGVSGRGGAGYGFGLGLRGPHDIGGGIVFQRGGGFGAVHNLDGKVDAEAAEQLAPAGRG